MTFLRPCTAALCFLSISFGVCQNAPSNLVGVRAELMRSFWTDKLKTGDPLFLHTSALWQEAGCVVPENTTIAGEVTAIQPVASSHGVSFALSFKSLPCSAPGGPTLLPVLIAMQGHREFDDSALKRLSTAGLESQTIAGMFTPPRPGVPSSQDTMLTSANSLSVTNTGGLQNGAVNLSTGEVAGIRGVRLELPTKTSATTLVCAHNRNFAAGENTFVFALIPQPAHARESSRPQPAAQPREEAAKPAEPDTAKETEVCAANGCLQITTPHEDVGEKAAWTSSIQSLGFQARPEQLITALNETAAVHYLGEDQILLTFTLHTLVKRSAAQQLWAAKPRKVRAVLLSRDGGRVLRVEDWTVPSDLGPYVWTLDRNRVLAQTGGELVVFGPGLVPQQRLPLRGPLIFLSVAPKGEQMLVATVHEKHTAAEHQAIANYLGPDQPIDEEYDLTAIDGNLHEIGSRRVYTQPVQPALFRSAMVTAEQGKQDQWQVMATTWAGQRSVLARVKSSCPVTSTALAGDLVLLRGCTPNELSSSWYRVLDQKGATVLRASYGSFDLLEQATTDASGALLALATAHFDEPFSFTPQKRAGDFSNLQLSVLRTGDSKIVFAAHLPTGSAEHQTFALSPSGTSLAVLTGDTLRLYPVETE